MRYLLLLIVAFFSASTAAAVDVGAEAPTFSLPSVNGETVSLDQYKDKVVVLEWFNKGCPFVRKHYDKGDMQGLQSRYADKGVVWLTINSTGPEHGDYLGVEGSKKVMSEYKVTAANFLLDDEGKVGKLYGAKTTPHMYVIDKGTLVYQGAIDDNPDASADPKKAKNYVQQTLNEVLEGTPVSTKETKPYGCSVKYN